MVLLKPRTSLYLSRILLASVAPLAIACGSAEGTAPNPGGEDFSEIAASRMSKDMHATSRVEIVVPSAGCSEPGHLAVLIARLCDQAIAWDNRTARPSPLHLGYTADRDHPDYGDHDPGGEADDDELEIDED